ncbi:phage holin family protein [Yokenella regensburgei]|uniref:phage holin family protein n=1 Tax=Yokenella regensburgei TaxID=158877 RepID=UPI0031E470BF
MSVLALIMNVTSCFLIVLRLMLVNRNRPAQHAGVAMITWLLAVAYFDVLFSMLSGEYRFVNPSEAVVNLIFCIALYACRGDMKKLIYGGYYGHK